MRSLIGRIAPIGLALLVPLSALAQATPEGGPTGVFRRATLELALDPDGGYRLSEESGTLAKGLRDGTMPAGLTSITPADVQATARKWLTPSKAWKAKVVAAGAG